MFPIRHHSDSNFDQLQASLEVCHKLRSEVNPTWTQLYQQREQLRQENSELRSAGEHRRDLLQLGEHMAEIVERLNQDLRRLQTQAASLQSDTTELLDGLEGCLGYLKNLQFLSNSIDPQLEWINLSATIRQTITKFALQLQTQGIRVFVDAPDAYKILVDRSLLQTALENLIANALESMPDRGELHLTVVAEAGTVEIEVADSGTEVDLREMSLQTSQMGVTALRRRVVQRIAAAHQGRMIVANCHEGGAAFTLRFPQPESQALRRAA